MLTSIRFARTHFAFQNDAFIHINNTILYIIIIIMFIPESFQMPYSPSLFPKQCFIINNNNDKNKNKDNEQNDCDCK